MIIPSIINNKTFGQISHEAEIALVNPLLSMRMFSRGDVQRRLAIYPFENYHNKSELICQIMDKIWPSEEGSSLFPIYKNFEHYLTASGKRGHFIHQFEVFLLGLNILIQLWNKAPALKRKTIFKVSSITELIHIWLLTSSTHDLGYPLQMAAEITKQLSQLYKELELTTLSSIYNSVKFDETVTSESELAGFTVESDPHTYYIKIDDILEVSIINSVNSSKEEVVELIAKLIKYKKHGYVSAKILCRTFLKNLYSKQYPIFDKKTKKLDEILKLSLAAITLHDLPDDCHKFIPNISFDKNPYAWLLFVIDNVQDWSRAIIPSTLHPDYHLMGLSITEKGVSISYLLRMDHWEAAGIERMEKELMKRKKLLKQLVKSDNAFDFCVDVTFARNDSSEFRTKLKIRI